MKNVTLTLEDEVARWARVWAAERDTSVSRFLGEILRERMERQRGYAEAMRKYLARKPHRLKRAGGYPRREDLHVR